MKPKAVTGWQLLISIVYSLLLGSMLLPVRAGPVLSSNYSLTEVAADSTLPLFKTEEVLHFRLAVDYRELLKDRGDERQYHPATITYQESTGKTVTLTLKVMVRGKHRRDPNICSFPPIMINFPRKATAGTVFAGTNKLKLVTHCLGEDYVLREYMVYKLYNLFTDVSFKVRLCKIEYADMQGKRKTETKYGFLIEDDKDMARRNDATVIADELILGMDETEPHAMLQLALFQYMIGNTDWSVPYRHNIKLLAVGIRDAPLPVPYDFDYCGIVAPPYAKPPPALGITSVRHRLFRGFVYPDQLYTETIAKFNNLKQPVYSLYQNFEPLDKRYRKQTIKFLDEFYETINDPKDLRKQVKDVGRRNLEKGVVVKGLE